MSLFRWIEVRPASSIEYGPKNFLSVLETLYNARKPFRFIMSTIRTESGRNIVRFYIQAEEGLISRLAGLLRSWLGVQVIMDSKPPAVLFEFCAEYDLRGHYALPIIDFDRRPDVNNIDGVAAALASEGGTFEVVAVADSGARRGIYDWIRRRTGASASFGDAMFDYALAAIGAIFGGSYKSSGGSSRQTDPAMKIRVDAASKKVSKSLFNCSIKVYGSADLARAVLEALPSSSVNRFAIARVYKGAMLPSEVTPPRKYALRNIINAVSPLFTVLILACAFLAGLITLRFMDIEVLIIALSIAPTALIKIFLPRKRPLILSADELSMIIGMPSGIGRLPVETALAPPTREVVPAEESRLVERRETVFAEAKRLERRGLPETEEDLPYQYKRNSP